jgi:hypothetical protein
MRGAAPAHAGPTRTRQRVPTDPHYHPLEDGCQVPAMFREMDRA